MSTPEPDYCFTNWDGCSLPKTERLHSLQKHVIKLIKTQINHWPQIRTNLSEFYISKQGPIKKGKVSSLNSITECSICLNLTQSLACMPLLDKTLLPKSWFSKKFDLIFVSFSLNSCFHAIKAKKSFLFCRSSLE